MNHFDYSLEEQRLNFEQQRHADLMELEWARLRAAERPNRAVSEDELQEILDEIEEEQECDCPFCRIEQALDELREMVCR